jgi:hypothetical protein
MPIFKFFHTFAGYDALYSGNVAGYHPYEISDLREFGLLIQFVCFCQAL